MREDLEHNFDLAEFNNSCRVMKCARQLFPHSEKQAQLWAVYAYERWTRGEGGTPEMQRDRRNPNWKKSLEMFEKRRQKNKTYLLQITMDYPMIDNTDAYIAVCEKANLPINKVPKKGDDISLAYEMAMKELNPHLYQNITSPDPDDLPADVAKRYKQGMMWVDDLKAYEECGFTGTAANIRKAMEQAQQQMIEQKTAEMKARNDARDEAQRNKPSGFTPQKNISFWDPSAVAFRRQHNISDDVGAGC